MKSINWRWPGVVVFPLLAIASSFVPTVRAADIDSVRPAPVTSSQRARAPDRQGERLRRADIDRDGYLSRAEAQQASPRLARNFDAIDANRDGRLSAQEIRRFGRSKAAIRVTGSSGARTDGNPARIDAAFAAADADGDGQLSRAEAGAALPRVASKFERIDADGDGRLSIDEWRAWMARRKAARAAKS